jgi:hypothetical protein
MMIDHKLPHYTFVCVCVFLFLRLVRWIRACWNPSWT